MREAHGPWLSGEKEISEKLWYLEPLPKDPPGNTEVADEVFVYFVGPLKGATREQIIGRYKEFRRDNMPKI